MPDYFAQDQYKELDPDARMLDDLSGSAAGHSQTQLRSLLGCFLFSEDDVFKKIGVLSGGERNRYALARMLLAPSNFLLLDEPTNHLDMRAKDVLLEALKEYNGTVVFVSHDRYFIDNLATRVFEIQEGHVHVYPGNYEDYLWRKAGGPEAMAGGALPPSVERAGGSGRSQKRQAARESDEGAKDARAVEGSGDSRWPRWNRRSSSTRPQLGDFKSAEETARLTGTARRAAAELEARVAEWEELTQGLDERRDGVCYRAGYFAGFGRGPRITPSYAT